MLDIDSKAGTLIHEMNHFTIVANTDDHVYGQTCAHNLAVNEPNKASGNRAVNPVVYGNADNHEYFSEEHARQQLSAHHANRKAARTSGAFFMAKTVAISEQVMESIRSDQRYDAARCGDMRWRAKVARPPSRASSSVREIDSMKASFVRAAGCGTLLAVAIAAAVAAPPRQKSPGIAAGAF